MHKVLVIDDEKLLVKSTCLALKYRGFETLGALDGKAGLTALETFHPDLILLDIMMPGLDGWEVLGQLKDKAETRNIPVIVFTAREYSNGQAMARERGAVDLVAKPFESDELATLIRGYVNAPGSL